MKKFAEKNTFHYIEKLQKKLFTGEFYVLHTIFTHDFYSLFDILENKIKDRKIIPFSLFSYLVHEKNG